MTPSKNALNNLLNNPTEENKEQFYKLFLIGKDTKQTYINELLAKMDLLLNADEDKKRKELTKKRERIYKKLYATNDYKKEEKYRKQYIKIGEKLSNIPSQHNTSKMFSGCSLKGLELLFDKFVV